MRLSVDDLLKDPTGEIAELRKLGITDSALITYLVRVLDGYSRDEALRGLLSGRRYLTTEQVRFIRRVVARFLAP